jgi:nucleoside-triphosphatase
MNQKRFKIKIFITGKPGVGKTTLIKKIADQLHDEAEGFYTEEIRGPVTQKREGFLIRSLNGEKGLLASNARKSPLRVGRHCVFLEDLERIGIAAIQTGLSKNKIILIDEIGPMELFSEKFRGVLETALRAPNSLATTIAEKSLPQFKGAQGVKIVRIDQENRDRLLYEILKELRPE